MLLILVALAAIVFVAVRIGQTLEPRQRVVLVIVVLLGIPYGLFKLTASRDSRPHVRAVVEIARHSSVSPTAPGD